jgi:hypothetical protein
VTGTLPAAPAVTVQPAAYVVTIWGDHVCTDAIVFSLMVEDRGDGQWSVSPGQYSKPRFALDAAGRVYTDCPDDPRLRFPLEKALEIARAHAATFTRAGVTPAAAYARHQAGGCDDD